MNTRARPRLHLFYFKYRIKSVTMKREFLAFYFIQIREKRETTFLDVKDIEEKHRIVLADTINAFLDKMKDYLKDDARDAVIKCRKNKIDGQNIYGFVSSGHYGEEGDLYNIAKKNVTQHISKDDAPSFDYYFRIYIPKSGSKIIFAMHSRGVLGNKTTFASKFKEHFSEEHQLLVQFNPLTIDFKKHTKAGKHSLKVRKIQKTSYIPLRKEDRLVSGKNYNKQTEMIKISHAVSVSKNTPSLVDEKEILANSPADIIKSFEKFVSFNEANSDSTSEFRITFEIDGQDKTVVLRDLTDPNVAFHYSFDITEDLKKSKEKDRLKKYHEACDNTFQLVIKNVSL